MKNLGKITKLIRLYGITLSIIWYLFGMSFKIDACNSWYDYINAYSITNECLEYFFVSLICVIGLSRLFEYIIKKDIIINEQVR